jgi:hypothetical protein
MWRFLFPLLLGLYSYLSKLVMTLSISRTAREIGLVHFRIRAPLTVHLTWMHLETLHESRYITYFTPYLKSMSC